MSAAPVALLATALAAGATPRDGFVRVRGTDLVVDGRPLRFVGANVHVMHGAAARAAAERTLTEVAGDGLRVVRLWALGEGDADGPAWRAREEFFRVGPDGWRPEAFAQLRDVLAIARRLDLRVIVTLANSWPDYGGVPRYLRWAGFLDFDAYGYEERFFTDARVRTWYYQHLRRVVAPFADDPTILAWELFNEAHGTPDGARARRRFFRDALRELRRHDRNHLAVPGVLGYARGDERREWVRICKLPEVAYCNQHVYPQHADRVKTFADLDRYLDDRVQLAHHVVGKPMMFSEYGFSGPDAPAWHRRLLERVALDRAAGALAWIYQVHLGWDRDYGIYVDRADAEPVRQVLREAAAARARGEPEAGNPALSRRRGSRPLFPLVETRAGRAEPIDGWELRADGSARLVVPVGWWSRARWEDLGIWSGILVHVWGAGAGFFEYRFATPPMPTAPARWRVHARLSSEYPGRRAPRDGTSRVRVTLDGRALGEVTAPADDGVGRWFTLAGRAARKLGREHVLRFAVAGRRARGLAIYGEEATLNREPVGEARPIEIEALP